jgi:hypothetical protein
MSAVNRLLEAASAPRIYRAVDLSSPDPEIPERKLPLSSCHGTPTARQIKNLSHARAIYMLSDEIEYDLTSCSFARVEVVQFGSGRTEELRR